MISLHDHKNHVVNIIFFYSLKIFFSIIGQRSIRKFDLNSDNERGNVYENRKFHDLRDIGSCVKGLPLLSCFENRYSCLIMDTDRQTLHKVTITTNKSVYQTCELCDLRSECSLLGRCHVSHIVDILNF